MTTGRKGWIGTLLGIIAAALLATAGAAFTAPFAQAASYDVWSCRGPAGEPLPATGWTLSTRNTNDPTDVVTSDGCASGGPLSVALAGDRSQNGQARGSLTFTPPAGGAIVGYTLQRGLYAPGSGPGLNYTFTAGVKQRTPVAESEWGCASVLMLPNWNCSYHGSLTDPDDPLNRDEASGLALDGLQLEVACIASSCDPPFAGRPAMVALHSARIAIEDVVAPTAPALSGSLTEGAPVDRVGTLVVESADEGGGIAATSVAVDGGAPLVQAPAGPRGTCAEPYTVASPCPSEAARLFTFDTSALSDGAHTLSGTVLDAAGNATPFGPLSFTVEHPPVVPPVIPPVVPPVIPPVVPPVTPPDGSDRGDDGPAGNGTPAVKRPRLALDRTTVTRTGRRAARVSGRLTTRDGQPIAAARLTVSSRLLGIAGGRVRALPPVRTDADGRFSVKVPGSGAERVELAFAPIVDGADTARADALVRATAELTARRSRARLKTGEAVVIAGRLDGAGASARGAVVELQAIVRGGWRTVGTVRAGADGGYRWRYRFLNTTRDTIFSFRALVRETPGWPWPELTTRTVRVRVDAR